MSRTSAADTAATWVNAPRLQGPVATAREVWFHRRFLTHLGGRAIRKMYARTVLGWMWLFIRPLFPILLRALVFGGLLGVTAEGVPYFLFLTVGTLSWNLFAGALMWTTRGLELNRRVVSQVYVPRVILPIATTAPALFEFLLNLGVLAFATAFYWVKDGTPYVSIGVHTLWSVAAVVFTMLLVLGIGFFTSVWGERARDARFTAGQLLTIGLLATPVLYPMSAVPAQYHPWLYANPMAAYVQAFKYGLLKLEAPDPVHFGIAVSMSVVILVGGLFFFASREEAEAES
jgi:lipopolysaccharide transport system permease protein